MSNVLNPETKIILHGYFNALFMLQTITIYK